MITRKQAVLALLLASPTGVVNYRLAAQKPKGKEVPTTATAVIPLVDGEPKPKVRSTNSIYQDDYSWVGDNGTTDLVVTYKGKTKRITAREIWEALQ